MSEEWEAEEAEKIHDEEVEATMKLYDYGCANGCEFDNPEISDYDEEGYPYRVCPICGTSEFTPNFKETKQ